ncbi:hypothetical protein [Nonomuraea sp. NPDC049129]|uniref:hypothetical protein n=1 Tax=Nonomuraea sp. NPDC049129 TaxID=3155272 RepID=UPI0033F853EF
MDNAKAKVISYVELDKVHQALPQASKHAVEQLWEGATTYVWGFQDGAGEAQDTNESWLFGLAYWEHALNFATEKHHCRVSIPIAFKRWRECGEIKS